MNIVSRILVAVLLGLLALGCATTRTVDELTYPYDPWYADLQPFSKDRTTDWALFDLGYPNLPDLRERSSNPLYDLRVLFR
jgi:hypothetical protein